MDGSRSGVEGSERGGGVHAWFAALAALLALAVFALLGASAASAASTYPGQDVLPENRAWEMVSPVDKNGAGVTNFGTGSIVRQDGNAVSFNARVAFPGAGGANGIIDTHVARRQGQDGWTTSGAASPYGNASGEASIDSRIEDLAPDLSKGLQRIFEGPLSSVPPYDANAPVDCSSTAGQVDYCVNGYLIDYETGTHHLLTPEPHNGLTFEALRGAGSHDYGHKVFESVFPLLPGAGSNQIYEYVAETGTLRLVGIDDGGDPFSDSVEIAGYDLSLSDYFRPRPVSSDGSRIYFQVGSGLGGMRDLYLRDHASDSFHVNESEASVPGTPARADFVGASKDGAVAYFRTTEALLDDDTDTTADLYRWELTDDPANDDNLTLISIDEEPADADGIVNQSSQGGLVGIDDTGDVAYFVSNSQLVDGEPTGEERYLYRWTKDGGNEFIAPLLAADAGDNWQGISSSTRQRVYNNTPNGRFALILTRAQLAPDDTDSAADAYRFDAEATSSPWTCVSCIEDVTADSAVTLVPPVGANVYTVKGMSDDGSRVFFESTDPLKPGDGNGKKDVFLWTDGEVHRISGGNAPSNSDFLGTDGEGDNAFFLTDEALSGWDVDQNFDVYVARVDGGVPEPEIDAGCSGDGCQGDPTGAPALAQIGSAAEMAGNNPPAESRDCSRIQRRAKKAKQQSKRLARKAKQADAAKKSKRLRRKAKSKKQQAKKLQRRVGRCQEGSR